MGNYQLCRTLIGNTRTGLVLGKNLTVEPPSSQSTPPREPPEESSPPEAASSAKA